MAKVLAETNVIIVGAENPQIVQDVKMIPAATMAEALAIVQERLGGELEVLIVPHALLTLPVIGGGKSCG
jgi:hypothetical protein